MKVIELTKGQVAIVDDEDFERIAQWRWHINTQGYAVRKRRNPDGSKTTLLMHREVLNAPKGVFIDHRNMHRTDNRRENLRITSRAGNRANSRANKGTKVGLKGVILIKGAIRKPYCAQIRYEGKTRHIGVFATAQEAHEAYCKAALERHGEFARFN